MTVFLLNRGNRGQSHLINDTYMHAHKCGDSEGLILLDEENVKQIISKQEERKRQKANGNQ